MKLLPALLAPALASVLVLLSAEARAQIVPDRVPDASTAPADRPVDPTFRKVVPERRNGIVLGMSAGVGFAGASGYPKPARLHDVADFYSSSPLLVGWSSSFFVMGALADWISFGPMFSYAEFESPQWRSLGYGVGFRGEAFPLLSLVPKLADLALFVQVGFGSTELRAKGPYPSSEGSQSFLGVGVHHEWRLGKLLGGHAAIGPYIEYDTIRAAATERHWLSVGVRIAWYGGHVTLDER